MSSIYRRKEKGGIWYYQFYVKGKKRSKSLRTKDRTIAKQRATAIEFKRLQNSFGVKVNKVLLNDCFQRFLNYKKTTLKESTYRSYVNNINQLSLFFDKIQVRKIDSDLLNEYINFRRKSKKSGKTIHEELSLLKSALYYAWSEKMIDEIPIRRWPVIKKIPSRPETLGFYSISDIQKLKEYFKGKAFEPVFLFALYTGCRRSEIAAINVADVDISSRTLKIHNIKTESDVSNAFRYISINDNLLPVLIKQIEKVKYGLLFPNFAKIANSQAAKYIRKACKATGVAYKRFHGIRHTMATFLIAKGMNIREVMAIMGWTELSTAERYTHLANALNNRMNIIPF